ncbi:MAG: alpha/beta fold hydrolase [Acidimicrobiia bacterium]
MAEILVNLNHIHYEIVGEGAPVLLIAGLSGVGRGWGDQIDRFGSEFMTIVPDHPGAGGSSPPSNGFTIEEHAADMAGLLRALGSGPAHIVGSSTGGAIGMVVALDHPHVVRSLTLVSSWARADNYFRHQFALRKEILTKLGPEAYARATALFLFSPQFFRDHYDQVLGWWERASSSVGSEAMAQRIDMILGHDQLDRIPRIGVPTLVVVGRDDACTPLHFSEEMARAIPGADLVVLEGGHLIYKEDPSGFHGVVRDFIHGL